jgi:hypothetical protein
MKSINLKEPSMRKEAKLWGGQHLVALMISACCVYGASAQLESGLEVYLNLDGNLNDTSAAVGGSTSVINATFGGATGSADYAGPAGVTGSSVTLGGDDGDDDHLSLGAPAELDFGTGSFTISIWTQMTDDQSPLNSGDEGDGLYGPAIIANKSVTYVNDNDDGGPEETIFGGFDTGWSMGYFSSAGDDWGANVGDGLTGDPNQGYATDENDIGFDTWVHHVMVVDRVNNELRRYHNGALEDTVDITPLGSLTSALATTIGGRTGDDTLWGSVDEVAIWTRVLTDQEIARISAVGRLGYDIEDIINDVAPTTATWTGAEGYGDFEDKDNWDIGAVPSAANQNDVLIDNGDSVVMDEDHMLGNLVLDNGSMLTIDMGVTLNVDTNFGDNTKFGNNGDGFLVMEPNSTFTYIGDNDDYFIGDSAGAIASLTMKTGTLLAIGDFGLDDGSVVPFIGSSQGLYNIDNAADDFVLGNDGNTDPNATVCTLNMSGSAELRVADDTFFGSGGGGEVMTVNVNMSGDSIIRGGWDLQIFDNGGGIAHINLSDNALIWNDRSTRICEQPVSGIVSDTYITIRNNAEWRIGDRCTIAEEDGTYAQVDLYDSGTLQAVSGTPMDGGDPQDDSQVCIGGAEWYFDGFRLEEDGQGTAVFNMHDPNTLLAAQRLIMVGSYGYGTLNQYAGTVRVSGDAPANADEYLDDEGGDFYMAYGRPDAGGGEPDSSGEYNIWTGTLDVARDFGIGVRGTATLNVVGSGATINMNGDLFFGQQFGQNLVSDPGGDGTLKATLTGAAHSVINVNGRTDLGIPGDVVITTGTLIPVLGSGYRPAAGDYTAAPLSWTLISYAGSRIDTFVFDAGYSDGSLNGIAWAIDYADSASEINLQALVVYLCGDLDLDQDVDFADYSVMEANIGTPTGAIWADGDVHGDEAVDMSDFACMQDAFGDSL